MTTIVQSLKEHLFKVLQDLVIRRKNTDIQMVIKLIKSENMATAGPLLVIVHHQPVRHMFFLFYRAFRHMR